MSKHIFYSKFEIGGVAYIEYFKPPYYKIKVKIIDIKHSYRTGEVTYDADHVDPELQKIGGGYSNVAEDSLFNNP